MDSLLYEGRRFATGAYGLPTLTGRQIGTVLLLILGVVGAMALLSVLGVLDAHGHSTLGFLVAGPLATEYREKRDEIRAKRSTLSGLYKEADTITDETKKAEKYDAIKAANLELAALVDVFEPIQDAWVAQEENNAALKAMGDKRQVVDTDTEHVNRTLSPADAVLANGHKSLGEMLVTDMDARGIKSYSGFRGELGGELSIRGLKALITSADMTPLEQRSDVVVGSAQEERTVADLMLQGTTTAQKVTYFQETTFTNSAAETDEGAAKPESALDFTLREDNVRKIATWVPVTDEMMEDVPTFESYLRGRLGFMVKQREELQLLRGAGTGVTILGLYNRTGVQTVTGYGLSTIDSILRAITLVQANAFIEPTALVIHPLDWFDVRTSKDMTGNYLLGPATQNPDDARPWGLRTRVTTNAIQNTALVGAFNQAQIFRRSGIVIKITDSHEDYFVYNKLAVVAEERLALAVYRPDAFCKVEAVVQGS